MSNMDSVCPICDTKLSTGLEVWHFECKTCHYECSSLTPSINSPEKHKEIDEIERESGLKKLRESNFECLLNEIKKYAKSSTTLLEVGCAHGWFLEKAQKKGFHVTGIEPDKTIYNQVEKKGFKVINGVFPTSISETTQFDIIVFNDVFEHIPNSQLVLKGCKQQIHENGLLVLNIPSSSGFFYRLSHILRKIGFKSPFMRLWNYGLPSPHLYYFNPQNIHALLQKNGFYVIKSGYLKTLKASGLYQRIINYEKNKGVLSYLVYFFTLLSLPIIAFLPKDIMYVIAQNKR